jgi:hypothetical protein
MSKRVGRRPLPITIGQRFRLLTVVRQGPPATGGHHRWWCECDCKAACVLVYASVLLRGATSSCGCLRSSQQGRSYSAEYRSWAHMHQRCSNPTDHSYPDYGGRGIQVCARWQSLELFLADMGPRPGRDYSIERIDVDGNYAPENCIWGTAQEQARNKRTSIWIEHGGERLHIKEWAERTGICRATLRYRYVKMKWSAERTLTTPLRARQPIKKPGS